MSEESTLTGNKFFTPFNIICGIIIIIGLILTILRFTKGLGAVTNLDHNRGDAALLLARI